MEITYDYYRIFYYVAKYKSFSRAAEILRNNQPNITKYINKLEIQLNCTLFLRTNRGVTLTPEGMRLYSHVSIAFEQLHTAELELANDKNLQQGIIAISTSEIAMQLVLLPILKTFQSKYPGIRLQIFNHTMPQAIQELKNGLVDFAIVSSPINIKKPLKKVGTSLKSFKSIMIGGPTYEFLANNPHHLAELSSYPLVCLSANSGTYDFYHKFYLQNQLILQPSIEASTTNQLLSIINAGLGIGFIPENIVKKALIAKSIIQIPLHEQIPQRQIYLIENENKHLSVAANAFKQLFNSKYK